MNKKSSKSKKSKKSEKSKENLNYMRIRPKDKANVAFYTPSADITLGMKGLLSSVVKLVFYEEVKDIKHPSMIFANDLAYFMKSAAMKDATWEEDGIKQLTELFDSLDSKKATEFLHVFFSAVMDYYWHSMRLTTESPCIEPKEMEKAIGISQLLRTMPKKMREEYLDHLKTYNILPQVFFEGALFKYQRGEFNDDSK